MTVTSVELDLDRQQKAKEYARIRRRLSYITMGIGVIGVFILLFTNLGIWLGDQLQALSWQPVAGWFPIQILVYFLILMLAYEIITAPIAYYSGFILPHRYGLSTMSLKSWLADLFKGLALSLVLEILVIEFVYALLAFQPRPFSLQGRYIFICVLGPGLWRCGKLAHRLALAVRSVAWPSGGTAPSCCIMPRVSQLTQCSATLPPAMRITLMPVSVTCLSVGGMPISVP